MVASGLTQAGSTHLFAASPPSLDWERKSQGGHWEERSGGLEGDMGGEEWRRGGRLVHCLEH